MLRNDAEAHAATRLLPHCLRRKPRGRGSQRLAFALSNATRIRRGQMVFKVFSCSRGAAVVPRRQAADRAATEPNAIHAMRSSCTKIQTSYYFEHDYENAVEASRRAIAAYPGYPSHIAGWQRHWASRAEPVRPVRHCMRRCLYPHKVSTVTFGNDRLASDPRSTSICSTVCARQAGRVEVGRSCEGRRCGLKVVGRARILPVCLPR